MRYLTFALTKGRLASKTLDMLEKLGITCEEMKDKDSRKLIFTNEELKLKFFLAKGPDVPTYVEYGAADIGVVGKDTIIEEGRKVHEVLDLGFGKCRMCVCGYEDAAELLQHRGTDPTLCGKDPGKGNLPLSRWRAMVCGDENLGPILWEEMACNRQRTSRRACTAPRLPSFFHYALIDPTESFRSTHSICCLRHSCIVSHLCDFCQIGKALTPANTAR